MNTKQYVMTQLNVKESRILSNRKIIGEQYPKNRIGSLRLIISKLDFKPLFI